MNYLIIFWRYDDDFDKLYDSNLYQYFDLPIELYFELNNM